MNVPDDLRYTAEHEWVRVLDDGSRVRVGITDFAQDALGDVVYVDLPSTGDVVSATQSFGETRVDEVGVRDVRTGVRHDRLDQRERSPTIPNCLNEDPYGDGWLCEIEMSDADQIGAMMDAAAYTALTEG